LSLFTFVAAACRPRVRYYTLSSSLIRHSSLAATCDHQILPWICFHHRRELHDATTKGMEHSSL